ncbi:MAG: hypothetical protein A3J37_01445 [Alphaproteobacteria bacterium RIFCSPHIGHO2_12_FULL_45_9]|nr:MAG: hypothetical protein A3B66_06675 [Alphaproteobacteria bacterium RIFCSPHIGHO2_02_FULL_46_13]OFW97635.1 MAG: hypothetical protein A3J37_01445 [Alphaproteobacteria bacterium RIFCSPHIGHO2_12_FULL_45_9]
MTQTTSHPLTHPKYRPDIDGLRAVAVLSVLFFHAFPDLLRGGFIGVDIFFVISGFLISTIIFQNLQSNSFSFIEFFSRRIRRIFPSLFVVMASSFIAGWFILSADEYRMLGKHMVGGATFISNILLWRESGYFDSDADTKIFLHFWSLGIEEQFYIIWPLMLWAGWKRKINLFYMLLGFAAISFFLNIWGVNDQPVSTFFSPQTRFWELLVGAGLAYMTLYKTDILQKYKKGDGTKQSVIGLLLIISSIILVTKEVAFPGWWAVLPVAGSALLIFAGPDAWVNRKILASKPFVWVGLISFPLYLWHWPLLTFARIIEVDLPPLWVRAILVLVSIVLAWASYQFVEKPLRFGQNPKRNTVILAGLMALMALVGAVTFIKDGFMGRSVAQPFLDFTYDTSSLGFKRCEADTPLGKLGLTYCITNAHNDEPINAVILGDSHADDKFNGIAKLDKTRNWMLIGHKACPPVYGVNVIVFDAECQGKSEKIIDWVIANKDIKTAVLSFYGHYEDKIVYSADHHRLKDIIKKSKITKDGDTKSTDSELLFDGLNTTVQKLTAAGKQVVVLSDVPDLPYFPKDCVRKGSDCEMKRELVDLRQRNHVEMLARLKQENADVMIFDPTLLFCNFKSCSFKYEDTVMYRDSHHLSLKGSDVYATRFLDWLGTH